MDCKGKNGIIYKLAANPIASGGEGAIHTIDNKFGHVAKLYKQNKITPEHEQKLLIMVSNPPDANALNQIAWPMDILYDISNRFVGFTMRKLDINEDIDVIYEYGPAAKYPHMHWKSRLVIARNLCVVLNHVHSAGHVCGDFNPKNISINPKTGYIVFLDADSFHIQDGKYRCGVAIPEYQPLEIQNKMRNGMNLMSADLPTFTKATDNFALAIHIFQLLMNGTHPFACRSKTGAGVPNRVENIINGRCPFLSKYPDIDIPVYAPQITILPKQIQNLFHRAFIDGHINPNARPGPDEWHPALEELEGKLATCVKFPNHQYYNTLNSCPWCDADKAYNAISQKTATASPSNGRTHTTYVHIQILCQVMRG